MPRRCVAWDCDHKNRDLYSWPKDRKIARLWTKFVQTKLGPQWKETKWSVLCGEHFEKDCFSNYAQVQAGFATIKTKISTAVPTIHAQPPSISGRRRSPSPASETSRAPSATPQVTSTTPKCRPMSERRARRSVIANLISEASPSTSSQGPSSDFPSQEDVGYHPVSADAATITRTPSTADADTRHPADPRTLHEQRDVIEEELSDDHQDEDYNREDESESESEFCNFKEPIFEEVIPGQVPPKDEEKYIVFESQLYLLFKLCSVCRLPTRQYRRVEGTMVTWKSVCPHSHETLWQNQPKIRGIPMMNIILSGCILFAGAIPTKILRVFQFANIKCHTVRTYFRHQRQYLHDAVWMAWKKEQSEIFQKMEDRNEPLMLSGDGRHDSMGHSAKFGTYTLMDVKLNKVISITQLQSNQTGGSTKIELEALKVCAKEVSDRFSIGGFISDRSRTVGKWVRESWKVPHFFDTWHIVKSMQKKLQALGKTHERIRLWISSLKLHLYWSALSSEMGDKTTIRKKWLACLDHLQDRHDNCSHGQIAKAKKWIKPGTAEFDKITKVLAGTRFVHDVEMMSSLGQTSGLEAYHSVINHFAPKMYGFSASGMQSRTFLAAMHYNENAGRRPAVTSTGEGQYRIVFPKYKAGGYSVKKVLVDASYGYVEQCFEILINEVSRAPRSRKPAGRIVHAPPLSDSCTRPSSKKEAVAGVKRRFADLQPDNDD